MRSWCRYLLWLATIPAVCAAYFWVPWASDWLGLSALLAMLAALFFMDELTR
jgi:hypothetical protein